MIASGGWRDVYLDDGLLLVVVGRRKLLLLLLLLRAALPPLHSIHTLLPLSGSSPANPLSPPVAQRGNKLYALGGYHIMVDFTLDDPSPSTAIANSHLYTIDLSGTSIDLSTDYGDIITATRIPNSIPRSIWSNLFIHDEKLHLFGGVQSPWPIYLANGSADMSARVDIKDGMWRWDIGAQEWLANTTTGLGTDVVGQAAKAWDPSGEVGWLFGGAVWTEQYRIGSNLTGNVTDFRELDGLRKLPQETDGTVMVGKVEAKTSGTGTVGRAVQGTLTLVPEVGKKGVLVLMGGQTNGARVSVTGGDVFLPSTAAPNKPQLTYLPLPLSPSRDL